MLYCGDYPKTKPDAKIKFDLMTNGDKSPLWVTTGTMSDAQRKLVKQFMPLIETALEKGHNVFVQGSSILLEERVKVVWATDGAVYAQGATPVTVYDPRSDPDLHYPGFRKHVKAVIREMIQSGELTR